VSITYSDSLSVALVIQHVMRMHHIRLSSVASLALPHFCTFSQSIFKKIGVKCVFWFSPQVVSETFLILSRIQRDIIKHVRRSSCKVPVIVVKILIYTLRGFKTSDDAFRLPYSTACDCSIRQFLDLFHSWLCIFHLSRFFGTASFFPSSGFSVNHNFWYSC
jgi:hypothetical protein